MVLEALGAKYELLLVDQSKDAQKSRNVSRSIRTDVSRP
jgi:hypothetical protein